MLADKLELLDAWFHMLLVRVHLSLSFVLGKILRCGVHSLITNYGLSWFSVGRLVNCPSNLVGSQPRIKDLWASPSWRLTVEVSVHGFLVFHLPLFSFPHLYSSWVRYRVDVSLHIDFKLFFVASYFSGSLPLLSAALEKGFALHVLEHAFRKKKKPRKYKSKTWIVNDVLKLQFSCYFKSLLPTLFFSN